jgi:hypothetical protein
MTGRVAFWDGLEDLEGVAVGRAAAGLVKVPALDWTAGGGVVAGGRVGWAYAA